MTIEQALLTIVRTEADKHLGPLPLPDSELATALGAHPKIDFLIKCHLQQIRKRAGHRPSAVFYFHERRQLRKGAHESRPGDDPRRGILQTCQEANPIETI